MRPRSPSSQRARPTPRPPAQARAAGGRPKIPRSPASLPRPARGGRSRGATLPNGPRRPAPRRTPAPSASVRRSRRRRTAPAATVSPRDRPLARRQHALRSWSAAEGEGELLHSLGDEPVVDPRAPLPGNLDQAGFAQDAQVMRDGRLRQPEPELADADLVSAGEPVDDRNSRRIRKRLEAGGKTLRQRRPERR